LLLAVALVAALMAAGQAARSAKQGGIRATAGLAATSPQASQSSVPLEGASPAPSPAPPSPQSTSGACGVCPLTGPAWKPHVCTEPPITPINCGKQTLEVVTQPGSYSYTLPGADNLYFYLAYESSGEVRITVTFDNYPGGPMEFGNGTGTHGAFAAGAFSPLSSGDHLVQVSATAGGAEKWAFYVRTDGPAPAAPPSPIPTASTPSPSPSALPPSPSLPSTPTPIPASPSPTAVPTPALPPTPSPSPSPT